MNDGLVRRRYRRITLRVDVSYSAEGEIYSGQATTLGAGGLFIATDTPLPAGTKVRVRFRLPGGRSDHELDARVVWANDPQVSGIPESARGMGVSFADKRPAARLAYELANLDERLEGEPEGRA